MDRLKVSRSWLYNNSPKLPFASRIGSRNWRYSEKGLWSSGPWRGRRSWICWPG